MQDKNADVTIAAIAGEGWTARATDDRQRPTREEVAKLAYQRYEVNGRKDGNDIEDWVLAEQELRHHYA